MNECTLSNLVSDVRQHAAGVLYAGSTVGLKGSKHATQHHRRFRRHELNGRARGGRTSKQLRSRVAPLQFGGDLVASPWTAPQSSHWRGGRHNTCR